MPKRNPPDPAPDTATPQKPAPKSWRKSPEEIDAMEIRVVEEAFREAGLKT